MKVKEKNGNNKLGIRTDEKNEIKVECPVCGEPIEIPKDVISGELVTCKICNTDFEVIINEKNEISLKEIKAGEDWGE
jgi:alpha-aminoadipate carrier protein LysW